MRSRKSHALPAALKQQCPLRKRWHVPSSYRPPHRQILDHREDAVHGFMQDVDTPGFWIDADQAGLFWTSSPVDGSICAHLTGRTTTQSLSALARGANSVAKEVGSIGGHHCGGTSIGWASPGA